MRKAPEQEFEFYSVPGRKSYPITVQVNRRKKNCDGLRSLREKSRDARGKDGGSENYPE